MRHALRRHLSSSVAANGGSRRLINTITLLSLTCSWRRLVLPNLLARLSGPLSRGLPGRVLVSKLLLLLELSCRKKTALANRRVDDHLAHSRPLAKCAHAFGHASTHTQTHMQTQLRNTGKLLELRGDPTVALLALARDTGKWCK